MTCIEGTPLLFDEAVTIMRERLAASAFGRLLPDEVVADLFCGGGGWTADEELRELGIHAHYAVNHSPLAISFHRANNPKTVHTQGDAWKARPRDVIGKRTKLGLLLASAACTTHSNARGSAPISQRVHMLGWCIARWLREAEPRCVIVENVPEWRHWGPLIFKRRGSGWAWEVEFTPKARGGLGTKRRREIVTGPKPGTHAARRFKVQYNARGETAKPVKIPDPARKGKHFQKWLRYARRLGYKVEWRILDAADFGNPSRRKRLFVMMRRDGQPIVWPEVTHGPRYQAASVGAEGLRHDRPRSATDGVDPVEDSRTVPPVESNRAEGRRHQPRHGTPQAQRRHAARADHPNRVLPYRTAAEIIDWSDLGTSIFTRPRPLKEKTLRRIAEGIVRFVLNDPEPFVLRVSHPEPKAGQTGGWHVYPTSGPMPTQTARQDLALCTPIVTKTCMGGSRGPCSSPADSPLPTQTTCQDAAIVTPVLMNNNTGHTGGRADGVVPTVTTGLHAGLVTPICVGAGGSGYAGKPVRVDRPARTVMCEDHRALVAPILAPAGGPKCNPTSGGDPLGTVLTRDHRGLISPLLARFNSEKGNDPANMHRCDGPLPTVPTENRFGLVTPVMATVGWGERDGQAPRCQPTTKPLNTVPAGGVKSGVVVPALAYLRNNTSATAPTDPLNTVVASGNHAALVAAFLIQFYSSGGQSSRADRTLPCVTTIDRHGLVIVTIDGEDYVIVDILFRMLRPRELAAAMGFPADYIWPTSQRDAVKLIGNAVSAYQARALILSMFPGYTRQPMRKAVGA